MILSTTWHCTPVPCWTGDNCIWYAAVWAGTLMDWSGGGGGIGSQKGSTQEIIEIQRSFIRQRKRIKRENCVIKRLRRIAGEVCLNDWRRLRLCDEGGKINFLELRLKWQFNQFSAIGHHLLVPFLWHFRHLSNVRTAPNGRRWRNRMACGSVIWAWKHFWVDSLAQLSWDGTLGHIPGLGLAPKVDSGSLKLTEFPFLETIDWNWK